MNTVASTSLSLFSKGITLSVFNALASMTIFSLSPGTRSRWMMAGLLSPVVHAIPVQLLAYHVACVKGTDVDQPRNLAKSVTVE